MRAVQLVRVAMVAMTIGSSVSVHAQGSGNRQIVWEVDSTGRVTRNELGSPTNIILRSSADSLRSEPQVPPSFVRIGSSVFHVSRDGFIAWTAPLKGPGDHWLRWHPSRMTLTMLCRSSRLYSLARLRSSAWCSPALRRQDRPPPSRLGGAPATNHVVRRDDTQPSAPARLRHGDARSAAGRKVPGETITTTSGSTDLTFWR